MDYILKYTYLGEYEQHFNSDNSNELLVDIKIWFDNNKPTENTIGYLYDELNNLITTI